jgi:hypothetical protein
MWIIKEMKMSSIVVSTLVAVVLMVWKIWS